MKALIDSGVWWKRYHGLPLHPRLVSALDTVTEWHLCPLSIEEMLYKWRHRPTSLPAPPPETWLADSLQGYRPALLTFESAQVAGLWDWEHGDPVDRALAAIAKVEGLTLIHTDKTLRELSGFPQKYFPNVA